MKRKLMIIGLAVVSACLATATAGMVFGQPDAVGPPPPTNVVLSPPGTPATPPQQSVIVLPNNPSTGAQPKPQAVVPPPGLPDTAVPGQTTLPVRPPQPVQPGASGQPTLPARPGHVPDQMPPIQSGQVNGVPNADLMPPATGSMPDGPGPGATADNPTGRQEPAVSLEWIGPVTARLNQPATYQILAKNISAAPVHNVVLHHRIPTGVRLGATDPKAVNEGGILTWDLGTLMPSQEKRIDLQIVPEAKVQFNCQASVTFTGSSTLKVLVREPKLVLKVAVPDKIVQGDTATVSLTVSNPGDGQADHVKVKALLPEGLEHARGKIVEVDLGNLTANENRTVQLVCLTKTPGPQVVDCTAVADAGLSAQDTAKLEVVLPRLDLAVSGPRLRYLERHATYTLKVTNPGSAAASNVSILHQLPQGFKFVTASNGGRHDLTTRTVAWFIGDLTPGESREVTLEAIAINVGDHRHTVSATAARGLKAEGDILTRVEGLSALLMELCDTDDPVEVGAETSYEIRVTNTGSKTETNLELVCTVPDKMEFRGAKSSTGCKYRVEGHDVIFEPLPRLAPRADAIYRVLVRGIAAGDLRFRARIRADGLTEPVLREESTKVYGDEVISH
jgi:uncharacterized repeat protein (TIGR01451 family)